MQVWWYISQKAEAGELSVRLACTIQQNDDSKKLVLKILKLQQFHLGTRKYMRIGN